VALIFHIVYPTLLCEALFSEFLQMAIGEVEVLLPVARGNLVFAVMRAWVLTTTATVDKHRIGSGALLFQILLGKSAINTQCA
jgi:hypothetical protein